MDGDGQTAGRGSTCAGDPCDVRGVFRELSVIRLRDFSDRGTVALAVFYAVLRAKGRVADG
jgi:hypothetical protein